MPQRAKGFKWLKAATDEILEGAKKAIAELDMARVERLIQIVLDGKSKKIFVVGVRRSGFVGRAFALRLMNLGFNVYFLGETIAPAAGKEDLIIAISGSHEKTGSNRNCHCKRNWSQGCGHNFLSQVPSKRLR